LLQWSQKAGSLARRAFSGWQPEKLLMLGKRAPLLALDRGGRFFSSQVLAHR
jgi:hypothetical protein